MMNWTVVGLGGSGRGHAAEIASTPGLTLSGVYDADPQIARDASERLGARAYPSMEALLEDPLVSGATVATPSALHAQVAVALLAAGKHVLIEKPFALDRSEAESIAEAARNAGRLALPFHNRRWDPDFRKVLEIARSGCLGEVKVVRSTVGGPSPDSGWRLLRRYGGGRLNDWGPHLFSQVYEWFGSEPVSLSGYLANVNPDNECDDLFEAEFRFAPGILFSVMMVGFSHVRSPRWEVFGSEGTLQLTGDIHGEFTLVWKRADGPEHRESFRRSEVSPPVPIYPAIANCLSKSGDLSFATADLPVSTEEGIAVAGWLEAVRASAGQTGRNEETL